MPEFPDLDAYDAWLRDQPHGVAIAMAVRSALRAAPFYLFDGTRPTDLGAILSYFRTTLTLAVAAVRPTPELMKLAYSSAANYSNPAASFVRSAAIFAYDANLPTNVFTRYQIDTLSAVEADSAISDNPIVLFSNPLYLSDSLDGLDTTVIRTAANADPPLRFWGRWYEGFLTGEPLDWRLQEKIALIPEEDWAAGLDRIAKVIAGIETAFLASAHPATDRIDFDAEAQAFRHIPIPLDRPDLIAAVLDDVSDALDDVLAKSSNGLLEDDRVARTVRRTVSRYANDPLRIERNLTAVVRSMTRQMTVSLDLPASEENEALRDAANEGARVIRATHPEVAEARNILRKQAAEELSDSDIETVVTALPVLEQISDEDLADEFREDITALVADRYPLGQTPPIINDAIGPRSSNAPPLGGVEASERIFVRVAKISMLTRSNEVVEFLYNHPARKLGAVVAAGGTVSLLIRELVLIGLSLL